MTFLVRGYGPVRRSALVYKNARPIWETRRLRDLEGRDYSKQSLQIRREIREAGLGPKLNIEGGRVRGERG